MENNLIHHFLENSAKRFPDKVAVIHEKTRATYGQVNADADRLAAFLLNRGLLKGDRVVVLMENSVEYIVAYYGILKAGAVAVPLSTDLKPDGLNPLLTELEPAAIFSSARFERLLQASDLDVPNLNTLIIHNPKLASNGSPIEIFSLAETTNHKQPTTHNPQHSTHTNVRATFFVLGWVAKKLPGLIREIHQRGHEVASHGNNHHLCTTESAGLLQKDLAGSKALLEDIIGSRVVGYRAPSFSINDDVLKVIEDAGYQYDASFNSFDKHGRYGRISTNGFRKTGIAYQISESFYEIPISNLCLQPSTFNL